MRLKVLACKVLSNELSLLAKGCPNSLDITFLQQGLHIKPQELNSRLQEEIDKIDLNQKENSGFDAILLAYGLCGNGISGLCSKSAPLVIPRAHDCITMLLGSKEKYREYFDSHGGTYWYTPGWIENAPMPGPDNDKRLRRYFDKFGDNADFLAGAELGWKNRYKRCAFIDWPELENVSFKEYTKECARFLELEYAEVSGSSSLLNDLLSGRWDDERFLVVPPGKRVESSFDAGIIKAV